jgi:hypothetical protein
MSQAACMFMVRCRSSEIQCKAKSGRNSGCFPPGCHIQHLDNHCTPSNNLPQPTLKRQAHCAATQQSSIQCSRCTCTSQHKMQYAQSRTLKPASDKAPPPPPSQGTGV